MEPAPPPPSPNLEEGEGAESEEDHVLKEEARLGGSPQGVAANAVLLALSRAARSFLLYEPSNEAIRNFLENLRRATDGFLGEFGELDLSVRPFEIVYAGEIVYLERDRERSLAFRLYRDGIRRLILRPGLSWHELLKLLEVVSIRYIGIRQTEDDMVVLLWKAGFQHLAFEAVEGFVADMDDAAPETTSVQGRAIRVAAPDDFDLPAPTHPQMTRVQWREVPQPAIEEMLAEDTNQVVPDLALQLSEALLHCVGHDQDPIQFVDIASQLSETRDFLFAEGLLGHTVRLAYAAASVVTTDENSDRALAEFLQGFVSVTALGRFMHSLSRDATEPPPELQALLDSLPGDHMLSLIELLGQEHGEAPKRVTRRLLEGYVVARGADFAARAVTAPAGLACELLRVLRYADINVAMSALPKLLDRNELEIQLEVLHTIEVLPTEPETVRMLLRLATAENEEVRFRAITQLGERTAIGAFGPLSQRLKREAAMRLTQREAAHIGRALALCDRAEALKMFRELCKPRGLLGSVLPGSTLLQWASVAGLALLPGDEPETIIKQVSERAGSELQAFCTQAMVERRRKLRGPRP